MYSSSCHPAPHAPSCEPHARFWPVQLWHKVQPATVMEWLNKTEGLTIMDKIEVLQAVAFHTHITAVDGGCLGLGNRGWGARVKAGAGELRVGN